MRVVLWPQSTKTSVGPPDSLCGGPVVYWKILTIKKQYFLQHSLNAFYDQCHIFFKKSYVLQSILQSCNCCVQLPSVCLNVVSSFLPLDRRLGQSPRRTTFQRRRVPDRDFCVTWVQAEVISQNWKQKIDALKTIFSVD